MVLDPVVHRQFSWRSKRRCSKTPKSPVLLAYKRKIMRHKVMKYKKKVVKYKQDCGATERKLQRAQAEVVMCKHKLEKYEASLIDATRAVEVGFD